MKTRTLATRWAAGLALLLVLSPDASSQMTVDVEGFTFSGVTMYLVDPPSRFAIHRQDVSPLIVQEGDFRDSWTIGIAAGLRFADDVAVEGMFSWVPGRLRSSGGLGAYGGAVDVNTLMYSGSLLYHFPALANFRPFLGAGVGGETVSYDPQLAWERHTDLMANVLVGGTFELWDWGGIRFEARDCITRFDSDVTGIDDTAANDLMVTAGLTYRANIR